MIIGGNRINVSFGGRSRYPDRGFDLQVISFDEKVANRLNDPGSEDEVLAKGELSVHDQ